LGRRVSRPAKIYRATSVTTPVRPSLHVSL
jgi:hypothetical protein